MRCCEFCQLVSYDCSCEITADFLDSLYDHDFHAYNAQINRMGKLELESE